MEAPAGTHTYDAPPCGPSVRVDELVESRKIPFLQNTNALFCAQDFESVAYLDCDVGQSEFNPSGMVHTHSAPVL